MQAVESKRWDDAKRETVIRNIAQELGYFPSNTELRNMGRGDVANQIAKNGGFLHWSKITGIPRVMSDSDTGWAGEEAAAARLEKLGFTVTFRNGVKCPYDFLVNDILRVDVKAARYKEYGYSKGWFYHIGKQPQADVILLWQLDTRDFFPLPWYLCPFTNITVSRSGGKYVAFRNNVDVIVKMISTRQQEKRCMRPSVLLSGYDATTEVS